MAFEKKTWTNRVAEYISRRRLTFEDGSTQLVTVTREEGEISEEGDAFSAENMNELEERISEEFTLVNNSLASKANSSHTHNYAAASHTHAFSQISGLSFSLSGTTLTITKS